MLRIDYKINEAYSNVNVTIVSEKENTHTMCGRLLLSTEDWYNLFNDLKAASKLDYRFENKDESK